VIYFERYLAHFWLKVWRISPQTVVKVRREREVEEGNEEGKKEAREERSKDGRKQWKKRLRNRDERMGWMEQGRMRRREERRRGNKKKRASSGWREQGRKVVRNAWKTEAVQEVGKEEGMNRAREDDKKGEREER
jgi:hypothetical protein